MSSERLYDELTEWMDVKVSRPYAFPVFGASVAALWLLFGVDVANFYISVVTVGFFFLFAYGARKDRLSNQRKHDEEIRVIETASDEVIGVETQTLTQLEGVTK